MYYVFNFSNLHFSLNQSGLKISRLNEKVYIALDVVPECLPCTTSPLMGGTFPHLKK